MGRTLYEAAPMTSEIDVRLRRIESRISRIEAARSDRPAPAGPPPVAPPPVAPPVVGPPQVGSRRWAEIGSRLEALAVKLKLHYHQAGGDGAPRTIDEVRESIRDAFTATENAVNDEAVRTDVREAGVMVAEAVADALTAVGGDLREALHRTEVKKGGTP
jgi:hypothetical protein